MNIDKPNIIYKDGNLIIIDTDYNQTINVDNLMRLNNLSKEVSGIEVLSKNKFNIKYSYIVIVEGYFEKENKDITVIRKKEKYSILEINTYLEDKIVREKLMKVNHPIIGDYKYNSSINPIRRICMHLYKIEIDDKEFYSDLPNSFKIFFQ